MDEKNNFALVKRPAGAVEKIQPGAKRILSGIVSDTLALATYPGVHVALTAVAQEGKEIDVELKQAAEAGDREAQFKLGQFHFDRRSYVRDRDGKLAKDQNWDEEVRLAFQWFLRAAEQGHALAQCEVAFCYESAWGVEQDTAKAFDYLRLAGANGCPEAWRKLAHKLIYGTRSKKSAPREGVEYMRKAAESGDGEAAAWLSRLYSSGRVRQYIEKGGGYVEDIEVTPDATAVTKWLRVAADQGLAEAQNDLGDCYLAGRGVNQDYGVAAKWYRKAALQGHTVAQENLGACYANGRAVIEDPVDAYQWVKLAEELGYGGAAKTAAVIETLLSPEEFQEAERRYRQMSSSRDGGRKTQD